jgi:hypothetical protein
MLGSDQLSYPDSAWWTSIGTGAHTVRCAMLSFSTSTRGRESVPGEVANVPLLHTGSSQRHLKVRWILRNIRPASNGVNLLQWTTTQAEGPSSRLLLGMQSPSFLPSRFAVLFYFSSLHSPTPVSPFHITHPNMLRKILSKWST